MRAIAFVLSLTCVGHGRRVQTMSKQVQDGSYAESQPNRLVDASKPSTKLSAFLQATFPEAGWQSVGPGHNFAATRVGTAAHGLSRRQGIVMETDTITDAEARAKAAAALEAVEEAAVSSARPAGMIDMETTAGPETYPLAAVVGQEAIKAALLLCGVNMNVGGVLISGSRGTGKSIMARALHKLLPPIEIVKGSKFNIDPAKPRDLDTFLKNELAESGKTVEDLETEIIPTPFVQVPLDVLEDRMLGSVDVEKSVAEGKTFFEPGLLAAAHRGVLYVDDINLLDDSTSNLLLEALSTGWVTIEREGLSVRHPFRPIMVATFNPEEGEMREHLMDRIGICLSADAEVLNQEDRIEAVERALAFATKPQDFVKDYQEAGEAMKTQITFARAYLNDLTVKTEQVKYLCENAIRAGVQGTRGEIYAAEVARANAALNGADVVTAEDLKLAVKLCIAPRGTEIQAPQDDEMMQQPPPPPPPPQQEEEDDSKEEEKEEEQPEQEQDDSAPPVPEEFMFDAEGVVLDPDIMKFAQKSKSGKAGSRGLIFSQERGRYIKPIIPKGKVRKLAVDATMRTAAPYQKPRRAKEVAKGEAGNQDKKVFIETSDVRGKKMARKAGSLVIFVVDASGSMALNRMNAAKGAAISLLTEAYESRDKVALITFQGDMAQVILPPTKSIAMARNRLERMPCGGGTPLAHALNQAAQTGLTAQKAGDVGEVLVVCIGDGRANVPLAVSDGNAKPDDPKPTKEELKQEVMDTAAMLGVLPGFKLLMLDSENKFVSTGVAKEIATAANGRYHAIPKADGRAISGVASAAIADMRN